MNPGAGEPPPTEPGQSGSGHYYRGSVGGPFRWTPAGRPAFARITDNFQLVKPALGLWVLGILIYGVTSTVMSQIAQEITKAMFGSIEGLIRREEYGQYAAALWLSMVLGMAAAVVVAPIFAGLYLIALQLLRGEKPQPEVLFSGYRRFADITVVYLVTMVLTYVGLIFCLIPGLVVMACLSPAYLYVLDRGMTGTEALRAAWRATTAYMGSTTLYFFLAMLIGISGAILCGVGIFLTAPILFLAVAALYLDLGGPTSTPDASVGAQ